MCLGHTGSGKILMSIIYNMLYYKRPCVTFITFFEIFKNHFYNIFEQFK